MTRSRTLVLLISMLGLTVVTGWLSVPPAEGNGYFGIVNPPMVQLGANERVGVTYMLSNPSSADVTFVHSVADFYVDGGLVTSVTLPVSLTVPAAGTATLASDVSISELIVQAAKNAGTDMARMVRQFSNLAGDVTISVTIDIKVGNSMTGPASVTEILLDTPLDSRTVAQFGELRGHAFIRGTGTGSITGEWLVDGSPVETFNVDIFAGIPVEVSSRESLTTRDLGEHETEIRITSPGTVSSLPRRYVVVASDSANQRVMLVSPRQNAGIAPDQARVSFRWTPMPGAARYEIAFSPVVDPLGLDAKGNVKRGIYKPLEWTPMLESFGHLRLLATVPGDTVSWTPNPEQHRRIFGLTNWMYWAVRAVYPGQEHGDPSTTSNPGRVMLIPAVGTLNLSEPANGASLANALPIFKWQAGPSGSIYEITISSNGKSVFTAMTSRMQYTLDDLATSRLGTGGYSWRVRAIRPGEGVTAVSENRTFNVAEGSAEAAPNPGRFVRPANAILQMASTIMIPLPNAVDEIKITPADGGKVESQQPEIGVTYPEALPGMVRLLLDGVDVTELAEIRQTNLKFIPTALLSPGAHTVGLALINAKNERLQSASKFAVELPRGWVAAVPPPDEPDTEADQQSLPMILQLDSRWDSTDSLTTSDALSLDATLRGQRKWSGNRNSYLATNFQLSRPSGQGVDLAGFIVGASINDGKYNIRAGDIGGDESPYTANGVASRSFNFSTTAGPIKLTAMQTMGNEINRSSIGRAPSLFLVTVQPAGATDNRGLKLIYLDSKDDLNENNSGFAGPSHSKILSLTGRLPMGKTGASLRGEFANSSGTFESAFGSQSSNGTAMSLGLGGRVKGFDVSGGYRSVGAEFISPASTALASNLRGWEFSAGKQLGKFVKSKISYLKLENTGGEQISSSSISSQALDLNLDFPKMPSVTCRVAKNKTSTDSIIGRVGIASRDEENIWSVTASYGVGACYAYLGYAKSDVGDKNASANMLQYPGTYTPNSRSSGTLTGGASCQLSKILRIRTYYGSTGTERQFRPLAATNVLFVEGADTSRQLRVEAEFRPIGNLSATMGWTKGRTGDALGLNNRDQAGYDTKLNYRLTKPGSAGGFVATAGWRRMDDGQNIFGMMINYSGLLSSAF